MDAISSDGRAQLLRCLTLIETDEYTQIGDALSSDQKQLSFTDAACTTTIILTLALSGSCLRTPSRRIEWSLPTSMLHTPERRCICLLVVQTLDTPPSFRRQMIRTESLRCSILPQPVSTERHVVKDAVTQANKFSKYTDCHMLCMIQCKKDLEAQGRPQTAKTSLFLIQLTVAVMYTIVCTDVASKREKDGCSSRKCQVLLLSSAADSRLMPY